jgi:hypothetical protein
MKRLLIALLALLALSGCFPQQANYRTQVPYERYVLHGGASYVFEIPERGLVCVTYSRGGIDCVKIDEVKP